MKHLTIVMGAVLLAIVLQLAPGQPTREYANRDKKDVVEALSGSQNELASTVEKLPTSCSDYLGMLSQYDWDLRVISAIMKAESNCNTDSVGDTWVIGGVYAPSCGLLQIRTLQGRPTCEQLKDPKTNIEWAYRLYKSNGYKPWSVFNNGKYQQWL